MNKNVLLPLICLLFFSAIVLGQKKPKSNGNAKGGRTNLLLPHGNIGIGTLSPAERLEVIGNVRISDALRVQDINVVGITATNLSVKEDIRVGRNILVDGNIGIGLRKPSEKLEIGGNLRVSQQIFAEGIETNSVLAESGAFGQNLKVGELFTVDGLTGLGVAEPVEKLEVAGNIKATGGFVGQSLAVEQGNFTGELVVGQNLSVAGSSAFNGEVSMTALNIADRLHSRMIESEGGAVSGSFSVGGPVSLDSTLLVKGTLGIGTDKVEGYMLSVNGKIRAGDDIRVYPSVEWADYVFENDYRLPSLLEVEDFIMTHGHLSEIPSALTVKEEGIELGEMNARLLQKIEELTLYAIAQEKALMQQKELFELKDQEIQELRSELEELKVLVKEHSVQN